MLTYSAQQLEVFQQALAAVSSCTSRLAFHAVDPEYVNFGYVQGNTVILVHLFPSGYCDVLEAGENSPEGRSIVGTVCSAIAVKWDDAQFDPTAAAEAAFTLTGRGLVTA